MYEVYKQIWNNGKSLLQYVANYPNLVSASAHARRVKGVVQINGHICLDLR
jgi:hypothetical protein